MKAQKKPRRWAWVASNSHHVAQARLRGVFLDRGYVIVLHDGADPVCPADHFPYATAHTFENLPQYLFFRSYPAAQAVATAIHEHCEKLWQKHKAREAAKRDRQRMEVWHIEWKADTEDDTNWQYADHRKSRASANRRLRELRALLPRHLWRARRYYEVGKIRTVSESPAPTARIVGPTGEAMIEKGQPYDNQRV